MIKASNSKKSGAGSIRESLLLNHQRFPSSSLSLSIVGESPSPSRALFSPHLAPESKFFCRSIVRVILVIYKASSGSVGAATCETHLAAKERESAIKWCTSICAALGARIRALMNCGWVWSEVGKEALRVLEELEPEPGENPFYL